MEGMGRHNLLNGHRGDDGAAAVPVVQPLVIPPPALRVRQFGPALDWTPPPREPEAATDDVPRTRPDADTAIRVLTAAVVLAVAAFAAVVSYSHIFDLGRLHGQDGVAARMLPLSVDGLIAAASLVMLHAARKNLPRPLLADFFFGLGVGATVAANVAYGLPFGWLAAVVSAWPAVAFVGSVEMAVRFVRDARAAATGEVPDVAAAEVPASDIGSDEEDVPVSQEPAPERQQPGDIKPASSRRQISRKGRTGGEKARDIIKRNPGMPKADIAKRADVTVRTVERVMRDMEAEFAAAAPADPQARSES